MSGRTRLALFGGSFDPVHKGHLETARRAQRVFELDGIVWVPAARPPHKVGQELTDGPARLAMLLLATMDEPSWQVNELELLREGLSYTFDTVRALPRAIGRRAAELDLFLLIGSDNLPGLPDWYMVAELLERVQPIVAWREGDLDAYLDALRGRVSGEHLRKIERGFLRLPPIEVSSTELREQLARGADPSGAVPEVVFQFIQDKGLYGWPRETGDARSR